MPILKCHLFVNLYLSGILAGILESLPSHACSIITLMGVSHLVWICWMLNTGPFNVFSPHRHKAGTRLIFYIKKVFRDFIFNLAKLISFSKYFSVIMNYYFEWIIPFQLETVWQQIFRFYIRIFPVPKSIFRELHMLYHILHPSHNRLSTQRNGTML